MEERRRSISEMPSHVQGVLLAFMQEMQASSRGAVAQSNCEKHSGMHGVELLRRRQKKGLATSRVARICTQTRVNYTRHQVVTKFRGMRLYTCWCSSREVAVEHQRILTRVRAALFELEARDPEGWLEAAASVAERVLAELGTSADALGLRAFVDLRAARYLGQGVQISSSAVTLHEAFDAYRRLLRGRAASWDVLRAEWLHQLQGRRRHNEDEASRRIDHARRIGLRSRLSQALRGVKLALAGGAGRPTSTHRLPCDRAAKKRRLL